jgi:hypothetical protein
MALDRDHVAFELEWKHNHLTERLKERDLNKEEKKTLEHELGRVKEMLDFMHTFIIEDDPVADGKGRLSREKAGIRLGRAHTNLRRRDKKL